jgi:hypothetical protein
MKREPAETLALRALAWIAADDDLLGRFLGASGAAPGDLVAGAADPGFLAAVLEFVLTDDSLVMGFCDAAGYPYSAPLEARSALPGGEVPHWT